MAKNFDQYDDAPVMAYLSKAQKEVKQSSNANEILKSASIATTEKKSFLEESSNKNIFESEKIQTNLEEKKESVQETKKILMNISIRETTKKDWKMFFLEHDLSMTQGIETAVEFLKSEVEKGHIRLSKGGITQ